MNILQKRDVILAAAILLLAAAAFGISHYIRRTPAAIALSLIHISEPTRPY